MECLVQKPAKSCAEKSSATPTGVPTAPDAFVVAIDGSCEMVNSDINFTFFFLDENKDFVSLDSRLCHVMPVIYTAMIQHRCQRLCPLFTMQMIHLRFRMASGTTADP